MKECQWSGVRAFRQDRTGFLRGGQPGDAERIGERGWGGEGCCVRGQKREEEEVDEGREGHGQRSGR